MATQNTAQFIKQSNTKVAHTSIFCNKKKEKQKVRQKVGRIITLSLCLLFTIIISICGFSFFSAGESFEQSLRLNILSSTTDSVKILDKDYRYIKINNKDIDTSNNISNNDILSPELQLLAAMANKGVTMSQLSRAVYTANLSQNNINNDNTMKDIITPLLYQPFYQLQYNPQYGVLNGLPISFDSSIHAYTLEEYKEGTNIIPKSVFDLLSNQGWSIHVTNKQIKNIFPLAEMFKDVDDIGGICWVPTKEIWIASEMPPETLIHEIAHAIDWECGGASIKQEWQDVMNSLQKTVANNKQVHDSLDQIVIGEIYTTNLCNDITSRSRCFEQYAQSFYYYLTDSRTLIKECPEVYKYFADRFGIINETALDIDEYIGVVEASYENGEKRRREPIIKLDVNDIMQTSKYERIKNIQDKTDKGLYEWIREILKKQLQNVNKAIKEEYYNS